MKNILNYIIMGSIYSTQTNENEKSMTKCNLTNEQLDFMRGKLHPDYHHVIVEDSFITDYYFRVLKVVADCNMDKPIFYEAYGGMGNNIVAKRNARTDLIEIKMINFENRDNYIHKMHVFTKGFTRITKCNSTHVTHPSTLIEQMYY